MPPTLYKHHWLPGDCWPMLCFLLPFLPSSLLSSSSSCFFPLLPLLSFTVLNNQTPLQLTLFTSFFARYEQASSLGDELLEVLKGEWSWLCVLWDWRAKTRYEIFHLEIYSDFLFFFKSRDFSEYMVCYTAGNGIKQVTFSFVSKQRACLNNYKIWGFQLEGWRRRRNLKLLGAGGASLSCQMVVGISFLVRQSWHIVIKTRKA